MEMEESFQMSLVRLENIRFEFHEDYNLIFDTEICAFRLQYFDDSSFSFILNIETLKKVLCSMYLNYVQRMYAHSKSYYLCDPPKEGDMKVIAAEFETNAVGSFGLDLIKLKVEYLDERGRFIGEGIGFEIKGHRAIRGFLDLHPRLYSFFKELELFEERIRLTTKILKETYIEFRIRQGENDPETQIFRTDEKTENRRIDGFTKGIFSWYVRGIMRDIIDRLRDTRDYWKYEDLVYAIKRKRLFKERLVLDIKNEISRIKEIRKQDLRCQITGISR